MSMKDGAEGSKSGGSSYDHPSGGHRGSDYVNSKTKFDNRESSGTDYSTNIHRHSFSSLDSDSNKRSKPSSNFSDDNDRYIRKNIEKEKPQPLDEKSHIWRGVSLHTLSRVPKCFKMANISLPPLRPATDHNVMLEISQDGFWNNKLPKPYSSGRQSDVWDDSHVHMPNSSKNCFTENGYICSRWEKITEALDKRITGSFELQEAILSYNPHYRSRWNFDALHQFFEENEDGANMKDDFFVKILPGIQKLALQLPELCPKALPILKQRRNVKLTLSQQQIACLLANAFFCTFPRRNFKVRNGQLPDINFSNLFADSHSSRKFEKFRCLINYFQRVTQEMPKGTVTYARQWISPADVVMWNKMDKKFTNLHVSTSGTIEDDGWGMLQADFANKYVGGGVLGHGLVQEEIRFLICPEMILSRLFTEVLTDSEVLIMTGCERFSKYEGYSETFKFSGNYEDQTERDEWGRRFTEVVAMDAVVIRRDHYSSQFEKDKLFRELNKAYCAFKGNQFTTSLPAVCTGNWGCGAFGGDKQLKAVIQMMAASAVDRDICYFTFGDSTFCDQLGKFHTLVKKNDLTICGVLILIKNYEKCLNSYNPPTASLFEYIAALVDDGEEPQEDTNLATEWPCKSDDDSPINSDDDFFKATTP